MAKQYIYIVVAILLAVSCTTSQMEDDIVIVTTTNNSSDILTDNTIESRDVSISVTMADATRVAVDDAWSFCWGANDSLLAWGDDGSECRFEMSDFSEDISVFDGSITGEMFRLIYPYSDGLTTSSGKYTIDLSSQNVGDVSTHLISEDLITEESVNDGTAFSMKHIGAMTTLNILFDSNSYNGYTISSIMVIGMPSKVEIDLTKPFSDDGFYGDEIVDVITISDGETKIVDQKAEVSFNTLPCTMSVGSNLKVLVFISTGGTGSTKHTFSKSIDFYSKVEFERATYDNAIYCSLEESDNIENDNWSLYAADSFDGGLGSFGSPYLISTVEQLAKLAVDVNSGLFTYSGKHFHLTCDLNLAGREWVAIGTSAYNSFRGTFYGNGYTISGLYINTTSSYQGLFGYIYGGIIKDLSIDGVVIGGFCTGSFVGRSRSSSVINCCNKGIVRGSSNSGGLVGHNYSSSTITNSCNMGYVSGANSYVGGVVGNNEESSVDNCYNVGVINGPYYYVGGVVGRNYSSSTVTNCYNMGDITGNSNVGGVVGGNYSSSTISECYNVVKVMGLGNYIGGVVGSNSYTSNIKNCYNTGDVHGNYYYVGGIVGNNISQSNVLNSYNTGNISGVVDYIGGVVGHNYYYSTIVNCYSAGGVVGVDEYIGGLVGGSYYGSTITNCYYDSEVYFGEAVGDDDRASKTTATGVSTAQMQLSNFVKILNSNASYISGSCSWVLSSGGYPTLEL